MKIKKYVLIIFLVVAGGAIVYGASHEDPMGQAKNELWVKISGLRMGYNDVLDKNELDTLYEDLNAQSLKVGKIGSLAEKQKIIDALNKIEMKWSEIKKKRSKSQEKKPEKREEYSEETVYSASQEWSDEDPGGEEYSIRVIQFDPNYLKQAEANLDIIKDFFKKQKNTAVNFTMYKNQFLKSKKGLTLREILQLLWQAVEIGSGNDLDKLVRFNFLIDIDIERMERVRVEDIQGSLPTHLADMFQQSLAEIYKQKENMKLDFLRHINLSGLSYWLVLNLKMFKWHNMLEYISKDLSYPDITQEQINAIKDAIKNVRENLIEVITITQEKLKNLVVP